MEVLRSLPEPGSMPACGLAIGNFDGVHVGHQAILGQLAQAAPDLPLAVMTFEPHPREFFAKQTSVRAPARISTEADKIKALAQTGAHTVVIVPFDQSLASMPAQTFIDDVISARMGARHLLVGDDFRFGHKRSGDYQLLASAAANGTFSLHRMQSVLIDGERVSSSRIRDVLSGGNFGLAARLLGHPYMISGEVARGKQLGRQLGFPTINIELPISTPAVTGIFVVQVYGLSDQALPGVASLGTRPAVESDGRFILEVHLLDFSRDVYGESVRVQFLHKLRDEADYEDLDTLKVQIARDTEQARQYFASGDGNTQEPHVKG